MAENEPALDLLSTSQTTQARCAYGAPMVAIVVAGKATIGQSCCNHWDCPACGVKRAKQEYRRIVAGCETLAMEHKLYFWTLTCRGKECSLEEAEENYYAWTNVLLTNARTKCHREMGYWAYVQITERQKKNRAHPHSHIITTFVPSDAVSTKDTRGKLAISSVWFTRANFSASLGGQHRISVVDSAAGVSRYVAKYMFKDTLQEKWPSGWKRVRYSQNWPPLTDFKADFVCVLRLPRNWDEAEHSGYIFTAASRVDFEIARHHIGMVLPPATAIDA